MEDAYTSHILSIREADAADEKIAMVEKTLTPGPFDHIFKMNNIDPEQIPGFYSSVAGIDGGNMSRRGKKKSKQLL